MNTRHMDQIPSLQSSENSVPPDQECGIHSIEINPSRTLLATGARNSNDVAVYRQGIAEETSPLFAGDFLLCSFYRLPTLDPICVGENAHNDWIFDQTWLDDQFLVSGSRDGSLALWRVTEEMVEQVTNADIPTYQYIK